MMRVSGLVLLLFVGCSGEPPRAPPRPRRHPRSEVAAEIGETQILLRDVVDRMRRDRLGAREAAMSLIDDELALRASRKLGLLGDRELASARKQAGVQKLLEVEVDSRVDEEVSPDKIAEEYRKAEALTADHILIRLEPDAPEPQESRARELGTKIHDAALGVLDAAAFAALGARFSTPDLRASHEDLGEFFRGSGYVDEFVDEAMKLERPGEISRPFRTQFGWHVVRLRSRRNLLGPSLEDATPEIVQTLLTRRRRARYEELVRSLQKRARVSVDDDLLARIAEP